MRYHIILKEDSSMGKITEEKILLAVASAAMLPADRADELSGDLEKIETMTARAASAASDAGEITVNPHADRSAAFIGDRADGTPLRMDECGSAIAADDGKIIGQSKKYDGEAYTAVPRIV